MTRQGAAVNTLQLATTYAEFLAAMRGAGMVCTRPESIAADGKLSRFHVEGDRHGSRNGWCVLHGGDHPAATFGHWRTGARHTWRAGAGKPICREAATHLRVMIENARRQRDEARVEIQAAAAAKASARWELAVDADPSHPYLSKKHVQRHGIRQQGIGLIVPLRDVDGHLWSIETIFPDGSKRFLGGGRKIGCMYLVGGAIVDRVAVCEGFATGASIHEATNWPVAVAFDAGNLVAVAIALRTKHPRADIVLMADNDPAGITHARNTLAVSGRMAIAGTV
ncbi:MAG: toprim domain-containing protein [Rhodanobacteraceae bacterium]